VTVPPGSGRLVASSLALTLALGAAAPVTAQDASPIASPAVASCTVEPRTVDEMIGVFFNVQGTPLATPEAMTSVDAEAELPPGEPADAETVAAVHAVVQELVACLDTGQTARSFTLMTDDLIRQITAGMGGVNAETAEELRGLLEAQLATPEAAAVERMEVGQGRDVRVLEEGRVGGIWTIGGDAGFIVFEQDDGRWLIDEIIDIIGDD
jgi:hypothetical protein